MTHTAIEAWQDSATGVNFYFSHSDEHFTTGVMVIPPRTELPKHNRPLAAENLVQIAGTCLVKLFDEHDATTERALEAGSYLLIPRAQFHIHANPHDETSHTLFKADGDITAIMQTIRNTFTPISLNSK